MPKDTIVSELLVRTDNRWINLGPASRDRSEKAATRDASSAFRELELECNGR